MPNTLNQAERAASLPLELPEPYLLTPGPLTTSAAVKQAMLTDWGSWDSDFRSLTAELRHRLLALAGVTHGMTRYGAFDCVPIQGSGTFVVEAMLGSLLPHDSKVLVLSNGAYGQRVAQTLDYLGRRYTLIDKGDYLPPRGHEVAAALDTDAALSHVVVVHCETSSGILNPIEEIAEVVNARGRKLLIDSMSAFGALPLDLNHIPCEALVSSANKCIEGVPGFGFVIARSDALQAAKGRSHSLSLDLYAQWQTMENTGQWRFTPPTHAIAAFIEALNAHQREGGTAGRLQRYIENRDTLISGLRSLGFETLLNDRWLSPIIVTFFNPAHPKFDFSQFYQLMKSQGFIIYPGKLTVVPIRIIYRLSPANRRQCMVFVVIFCSIPTAAKVSRFTSFICLTEINVGASIYFSVIKQQARSAGYTHLMSRFWSD